ncbi:PD40 domain-containing protein [bacterium]|nr:PD40 domain-containing protein [bacterium]
MLVFSGHTKRVNGIAFSPDGQFLASTSNDGSVRLWDTLSRESTVVAQSPGVWKSVAFSSDGRHLLARPWSGGVRAWKTADSRRGRTLIPATNGSYTGGLAVAPGRVAANQWLYRPFANVIRVWEDPSRKGRELYRTTDNVSLAGLAFDPSGTMLATAVGVLDAATGAPVVVARIPGDLFRWSPAASVVASAGYSGSVWVTCAESGALLTTLRLDRKHVQDFAFSPDGRYLAVVSNEQVVRVWETAGWTEQPGFAWGIGQLKSIAFAPDGTRAAVGGHRGEILVWDWEM